MDLLEQGYKEDKEDTYNTVKKLPILSSDEIEYSSSLLATYKAYYTMLKDINTKFTGVLLSPSHAKQDYLLQVIGILLIHRSLYEFKIKSS